MTPFDRLSERFSNLTPISELRSQVSIMELASYYGYQQQLHKGTTRPVLMHSGYQDTILIKNPQNASNQIYQRVGDFGDKGTLIDFIRNRLTTVFSQFNKLDQHELRNITDVLYYYLRVDPNSTNVYRQTNLKLVEHRIKQPFVIEQFDLRPLAAEHYLLQRRITPTTLQRPEFAGKVLTQIAYYNDHTRCVDSFLLAKEYPERSYRQLSNIAFPYYDGQSDKITGLELRNKTLKLHAPGSNRYSSVFVSNPPPKSLRFFVMESAIDALSHRQLRLLQGDERFDSVYFSTGGQLTDQQVNTITYYVSDLPKEPDWVIYLAFDNDVKGRLFALQFIQQMVASKVVMRPTRADVNQYTYELLQFDPAHLLYEGLLERIQAYNTCVRDQLDNQPIRIDPSTNPLTLSIPKTVAALSAFCRDLLKLTGLEQRVTLLNAQGKDFNEDLAQWTQQAH